ncbi:MAG: hypothetical protein GXN92_01840 [Candidatus Micrarchaeota archaeon]|nr:hypothetical protein [Candidatus Micrarchaeota archaeon]
MKTIHKGTYVEVILGKDEETVKVKGTTRFWEGTLNYSAIMLPPPWITLPAEGIVGGKRSRKEIRVAIGILPDNGVLIGKKSFENIYRDGESYLSYQLHGPAEIWEKYLKLLDLFHELALYLTEYPPRLSIYLQDYRAIPHLLYPSSYYIEEDRKVVIVRIRGHDTLSSLIHELSHHLYYLSPASLQSRAIRLWEKIEDEEVNLLKEGEVLRNSIKIAGHPEDSGNEMLASAMTIYLLQNYAKNPISPLLAAQVIEEVWGTTFLHIINRKWLGIKT